MTARTDQPLELSGVPGSEPDSPPVWQRLLVPILVAAASLALAASAAALLLAVTDDDRGVGESVGTLDDIPKSVDAARGEIFAVAGAVERRVGPGFVLRDGDERLLVMPAQPALQDPAPVVGREVLVAGAVREVQDVDFGTIYGEAFDEGLLDPFEPGRVLVATAIDRSAPAS